MKGCETMIDKFTTTMQSAIAEAQQIAVTRQHQQIDIPHLWHVFLQPDHFAYQLYDELNVPIDNFKQLIEKEIDGLPFIRSALMAGAWPTARTC